MILEILLIKKKQFLASNELTMKPKILDCTLRDGGYYTNWDFDETIVEQYIKHTNNIPIDFASSRLHTDFCRLLYFRSL